MGVRGGGRGSGGTGLVEGGRVREEGMVWGGEGARERTSEGVGVVRRVRGGRAERGDADVVGRK